MTTAHARPCGIADAAYHLPGPRLDVDAWARETGAEPSIVARMKSLGAAHFHRSDEEPLDLLVAAVDHLAAAGTLASRRVGLLVHFHTLPYSVPLPPGNILASLKRRYGLPPEMGACSITGQNCVSFFTAVDVACRALAVRPGLESVLVVGADRLKDETMRILHGIGMLSDGACAFLVTADGARNRIRSVATLTDGRFADGYLAPRDRTRGLLETQVFYLAFRKIVAELLEHARLLPSAIAHLHPHNANRKSWHRLADTLGIAKDIVFDRNIGIRGHAFGCDSIVNLVDNAAIKPGEHVLSLSSGYGMSFGGMVVEA